MWCICWRSLTTGYSQCGEPVFKTVEAARNARDSLNAEYVGLLHHWVEYREVTSK
jgi:hypothetical protein